MSNYKQLTRELRYQIYALMKAGPILYISIWEKLNQVEVASANHGFGYCYNQLQRITLKLLDITLEYQL